VLGPIRMPEPPAAGPPAATERRGLTVFRDLEQVLQPANTDAMPVYLTHPVLGPIHMPEPPAATAVPRRRDLKDYLQKQKEVEWVLVECPGQGMQLRPKDWVFKEVEMANMD
jgi:hypothetical protein